jgi:SsrA-binding protein
MAKQTDNKQLVYNRKARHDFSIEKTLEAGLALLGWEVKSLREGRGQMKESYVVIRQGEAWLIGAHISPLSTIAKDLKPDPTRSRKLLLNRKEMNTLIGAVQRQGMTIVPLSLYWKKRYIKCEIGLAKGKKHHDKRHDEKQKEWQREKNKLEKIKLRS